MSADIELYGAGDSVALLIPRSDAGRAWIEENLPHDAPRMGKGVAVEARYLAPIIDGMLGDGLAIA
jgi:hypothetical protein